MYSFIWISCIPLVGFLNSLIWISCILLLLGFWLELDVAVNRIKETQACQHRDPFFVAMLKKKELKIIWLGVIGLVLRAVLSQMGNFSFDQFHSHFLPNDYAFWQFSWILEMFRDSGKLPKCKVIWQKIAVELIKLWQSFVTKFDLIFLGLPWRIFHGVCVSKYFLFGRKLPKPQLIFWELTS